MHPDTHARAKGRTRVHAQMHPPGMHWGLKEPIKNYNLFLLPMPPPPPPPFKYCFSNSRSVDYYHVFSSFLTYICQDRRWRYFWPVP